MSQAYERFAKRRMEPLKKVPNKYNMQRVSFDDSVDTSRSDLPNIFTAERTQTDIPSVLMRENKANGRLAKQESLQELQANKEVVAAASPAKQQASSLNRSDDESEEQQDIPDPEVEMEPHTSLSLLQIVKLYLGEYLFGTPYPMRKAIYINNNNDQENEINRREFHTKFKDSEKEISHFDNALTVHPLLLLLALTTNVLKSFHLYLWVAVIIVQAASEASFLNGPIQYGSHKGGLIAVAVVGVVVRVVGDWLSVRKRREWEENTRPYRVYHHNGKMAEWVNLKGNQIKPGHVYAVPPGEHVPTDCLLLHSQHSLVHIKENHILSCLVEPPSQIVLKETLMKGESVELPLSGSVAYEISAPEYSEFQLMGKLNLEEPSQVSHPFSMSQVILRGSLNYSDTDILCVALETGIDSLLLKNLQYPFQHRKIYEQPTHIKSKVISDEATLEIKEKEATLLGVPIEKRLNSAVRVSVVAYLMLTGVGVLASFLYRVSTPNESYLSTATIPMASIFIYHLTNFIILVPLLLAPLFKLFVALSGALAQASISSRQIDVLGEGEGHRRTGSLSGSHNEELLDNKKIVFPVKIKDHNLLHQLPNVDTIVTTIDCFRDESAFTLHSIKLKGITHNFTTTSLDNELYSTEAVEDIRSFMSFAVLTTTCQHESLAEGGSADFDGGIEMAGRKYLDIRKVKNAFGETLINNREEFKVKHLFSIDPTSHHPYKVVFLQPLTTEPEDNPEVLVLLRGDTKTILDKTYGKEIEMTAESRKLHEEKDFYVQLMAKTSIHYSDALEIQRAYTSNTMDSMFFYRNLDKFISKVQPMGLLIFNTNFFHKRIGQSPRNPLLNKSIITHLNYHKTDTYDADVMASQHLPTLIVLCPASKSAEPGFESIHTIKSLLTSSTLFNLSLSEVGDKILHEKPTRLQKMMEQLETERLLVWNGWEQRDITYTIDVMRKHGKQVMLYLEKDEYMYLMKECDCSVKGGALGYDSAKYSDITLSSSSALSFFYLTQLIRYDGVIAKQGLLSMLLTQVSKVSFYLVVEFINLFYTRATGLSIVRTPLYLVVEAVLALDVLYYLNWKDSMRANTFKKRQQFSVELSIRVAHALLQSVFATFICLYSLESPADSTGTSLSYHLPYFTIVFTMLHVFVLQKLFNVITLSFSAYKALVVGGQLLVLYIGFIIVSATDTYGYYGILWTAMTGKSFLTAVCCVWIALTLPAIRILLHLMKEKRLKRPDKARKTF